jgi:dTDP-glucose 4,6-dehydratase
MSILEEIIPTCLELGIKCSCNGFLNAVNPEPMTHKDILQLYKAIVDPTFNQPVFVDSDHWAVSKLRGRRSNCKLSTSKIERLCEANDLKVPSMLSEGISKILNSWRLDRVCIVTGAAGFIGSHVLETFLKNGLDGIRQYIVVDNLSYAGSRLNLHKAIRDSKTFMNFVDVDLDASKELELIGCDPSTDTKVYFAQIDISDDEQVKILDSKMIPSTASVELIVHLAAQTHVDRSFHNSTVFTKTNVLGTHHLLELSSRLTERQKRSPLFLHVSTDEVHGTVDDDLLRASSEPYAILDPTNPYAASKAAAEMIVRSYGHSYKIPYVITRCNNVFGPRQFPEKIIPTAIDRWSRGLPLEIHGNGTSKRHFLYVTDAADAFLKIARYMISSRYLGGPIQRSIMISGLAHEYSVMEVVEKLRSNDKLKKFKCDTIHVQDRPFNDVRYYSHRDVFLWDVLGWEPRVDFDQGIDMTIDSMIRRDHGHDHDHGHDDHGRLRDCDCDD